MCGDTNIDRHSQFEIQERHCIPTTSISAGLLSHLTMAVDWQNEHFQRDAEAPHNEGRGMVETNKFLSYKHS